ncbi:Uracil-DNA glycosylase, family 1 [hydrothermal vent metagenome]|uniref:uracil-DNA glycosylase n=1 Tax=hydrothermal vent metagenome TaxID=652676 RepID=A0A3B0WI72_9ZZZZ
MNNAIKLPKLHKSWKTPLSKILNSTEILGLQTFLQNEISNQINILPNQKHWFNALNSAPLNKVKVVILGQDPYPTPGYAHGLCFSVMPEVNPIPKSLLNIYKELNDDLGITNPHGNLQNWANQGVLLLNSVLTVKSGEANSHQGKGWETLTDKIISTVNDQENPVAFVLWGAFAQKKSRLINSQRHLIIRSPHPSPLSAYRGFFGSKPFSKINAFLKKNGLNGINWQI